MFDKINSKKYRLLQICLYSIAIFIIGFNVGIFSDDYSGRLQEVQIGKEQGIRLAGYKYVNPLLECDIFNVSMTTSGLLEKMRKTVAERLSSRELIGASMYFRDLNNGPWVGVNEETKFTPASLMKVPIMIAYFKSKETDPALSEKKVVYKEPAAMLQNIKDEYKFINGKEYTIDELVNIMILNSSNRAAELVLQNINATVIQKIFHDFNVPDPTGGATEDYMSVRNYASFFRILYNASYLNKENSENALALLAKSHFKDGLVAGLPVGVEVSHKFGERRFVTEAGDVKQLHDCGVVYANERRYVLCVMTRGRDFEELKKAIKDVSKIVYNDFVLENK